MPTANGEPSSWRNEASAGVAPTARPAIPAPIQRYSFLCIGAEGYPDRAGVTPVYAPDGAAANGNA